MASVLTWLVMSSFVAIISYAPTLNNTNSIQRAHPVNLALLHRYIQYHDRSLDCRSGNDPYF